MLRYDQYTFEEKDSCEICDEQIDYLVALSLTRACTQIGK